MKLQASAVGDLWHLITPGIRLPDQIVIQAEHFLDDEPSVDGLSARQILAMPAAPSTNMELGVTFDSELDRYRVVRLTVDAGEREVTGTLLRKLRIQELMRAGCNLLVEFELEEYDPKSIDPDELAIARRRGPSDEILWSVAHVYRSAAVCDDNAASVVAGEFALQPRTATNWIRRARLEGFLDTLAPGVVG